jgi:iron complex outermembrane receptor protein
MPSAFRFYAVLGAEYDIKPVDGLTATAREPHRFAVCRRGEQQKARQLYDPRFGRALRLALNQNQNQMVLRAGVIT